MHSADTIDAVVFDMGGVFVVPNADVLGGALTAAGIGHAFSPDRAHDAHSFGVRAITELLEAQDVHEHDLDVWAHYDRASFAHGGVHADDLDAAVDVRRAMRAASSLAAEMWNQRLDANIAAFARIAGHRPVAIVTNNDGTAVDQCRRYGICALESGDLPTVAAIVDSTAVGIAKPDPAIFGPALTALGTEPSRTLYVGDTVHADVHGAEAAGMAVVQLDPLDLHADHDHWRLPDVDSVASAIGA